MKIYFHKEDIDFDIKNKNKTNEWISFIAENEGYKINEINYIFCSDTYLLNVNKEYLKHDYFTDVITFDYTEDKKIMGDIFISIDRINENFSLYSNNFYEELYRVMAHGLLHILGYNDSNNTEKMIMTEKEDYYLLCVRK